MKCWENKVNHFTFFLFVTLTANTGLYAHYVFNTLDKDHTGTLSFEVSSFIFYSIQFGIILPAITFKRF